MCDGDKRDRPRCHRLLTQRRGFQCLEIAAGGAVDNLPPTGAQLLADRIGRLEVAIAPALYAFSQQLFGL